MLSEYTQQQLLREMLIRRPDVGKVGFEEELLLDDVKINGCKKRKLYQPVKNGGSGEFPAAAVAVEKFTERDVEKGKLFY